MVHYVPASIENITEVTEQVVDEKNMHQMKLKRYESAVVANNTHGLRNGNRSEKLLRDDLIECRF